MRFMGRQRELEVLERTRKSAEKGPARMTVVTGRRRVGKTTLIQQSVKGETSLYFFISQRSEAQLCQSFTQIARSTLGIFLPSSIQSFAELFEALMYYGKERPFTLILDEFQNFISINPSIYSLMQDIWDRLKDESRIHLILSGSSYTLMQKIFEDSHQPLFGRATTKLHVYPFRPSELKTVIKEAKPDYEKDDLLALYAFTGGVPFYVADLIDNDAYTKEAMINWILSPGTLYKVEGRDLLRLEIGEGSKSYRAILNAIANGATKYQDIETLSGESNISPYLERLERSGFIEKIRPLFAKPNTRSSRWTIKDPFMRFWYRFIMPDEGLLDAGFTAPTVTKILSDFATFSGPMLEKWFRESLMETGKYREVGAWWDAKGTQNELDIVAIEISQKNAFIAEVKRKRKAFHERAFRDKVEHVQTTVLNGYTITTACLTLDEM